MSKAKPTLKLGKKILTCPIINKDLKASFICNNLGNVSHVQIPINNFVNFMNDHDDMMCILNSRHDEYIPWEDVKKQLDVQHAKRRRVKKGRQGSSKTAGKAT